LESKSQRENKEDYSGQTCDYSHKNKNLKANHNNFQIPEQLSACSYPHKSKNLKEVYKNPYHF
ncbi:hypothetical protein ACQ1Q5_02025, partial [Ornithobacterium rhinotracheale]